MKKVLYGVLGIIGIWLALFLLDLGLCVTNHRPFLSWKQEQYVDGEEHVIEYYGLGYKVVEYSKGWLKEYKMVFLTTQVMQEEFAILDDNVNCKGQTYYFYEDTNFKYYFNCSKEVKIRFKDGTIMKIEEALQNKKVTIEQLEEKGLSFSKESKILYTLELKKDRSCSYLEADATKLQKITNQVSYYCMNQVNIYVNRNYDSFANAYNKTIYLENLLYDMKLDTTYSSGAKMYSSSDYRILVCSNKNIVLGPREMEYFDIFCE